MYCRKCGCKVEDNWTYCPRCKNYLKDNIEPNSNKNTKSTELSLKEKIAIFILMSIFFASIYGIFKNKFLAPVFILSALASILIAFFSFKNNKIIRIIFWFYVICLILFAIVCLISLISCIEQTGEVIG